MPIEITEIRLADHSNDVIQNFSKLLLVALRAVGSEAERYAKDNCPVDTGRLRNSITWATTDKQSRPNTSGGENAQSEDYKVIDKPEELTVYIGTNVKYAPTQEYGDFHHTVGAKHFLRNAAADHTEHYKEIIEAALKSGT